MLSIVISEFVGYFLPWVIGFVVIGIFKSIF